jgi:DNA topoisomerase-1
MRDEHAKVAGERVRFEFRGKSGVQQAIDLRDRRLARIVKACRDLPGQELFQYVGQDGVCQSIGSADVNGYLREATGQAFTAKDFRTWAGTVLAARALAEMASADAPRGYAGRTRSAARARREIARAVETVAKSLGNTKAVCRKSYVHPAVLEAYVEGVTIPVHVSAASFDGTAALTKSETAVLALLTRRLPTKKLLQRSAA